MKTKFFGKLLAFAMAVVLSLGCVPTANLAVYAEEESQSAVILYTNDVHTHIEKGLSYASIADMKKTLTEELGEGNVLLVDAGDHVQGTAYGSMDDGETIIKLMNAAGYDLATLGNHEFDYGMARMLELTGMAEFDYVSSNFYHEKNGVKGENVFKSYKVFELAGHKVAFVGITTPESFTKSTPAYFQDTEGNYIYGIAGGTDGSELYETVQAAIDEASKEADIVIALGHLGIDPSSQPWTSEEVIANTTGLDAFIDGHSHSTVEMKEVANKDGENVVLTQTGSYFNAIGEMTIAADGTITTKLVTEYDGEDATVKQLQDDWMTEIQEKLGEKIGTTDITFDNYKTTTNEDGTTTTERLVRKQETNTGDLAADALYYLFDNMDLDVDVAIMNGGGIRNEAITGDLTYLSCKTIHTFGNVACLQTITGQQLLDALEWGARGVGTGEEIGGFLQVSGITYQIHSYIEPTVQYDEKGVWTGGPTGEYRVQNVKVYNKETGAYEPLDLDATYNLAGYNYTLRDLGDGFAMFDGAVNVIDYVMEDYMVLANYIQSFPVDTTTGLPTITAENSEYEDVNGAGRITIYDEQPALYYGDVDQDYEVTATDALEILKYVVKLSSVVTEDDATVMALADVDHDNAITAADALGVLRVVVKFDKAEEYTGEEPAASEAPAASEEATEAPASEEPAASEEATEAPASEEPAASEEATEAPASEEPAASAEAAA